MAVEIEQGNLVKRARLSAGLSRQDAAQLVYASARTWDAWESGLRPMPRARWELFLLKCSHGGAWERLGSIDPSAVKAARTEAGLSAQAAATMARCGLRTWQAFESGDARVNLATFELFLLKCLAGASEKYR